MRLRSLFVLLLLPSMSMAGGIISKPDFYAAINGAMNDLELRNQTATGETLALEEVAGVSDFGTWQVVVTNACAMNGYDNPTSNNYGKAVTFRSPAVLSNQGGSFVFLMVSQGVTDIQRDAVEKKLVARNKTLNGEYSDLEGVISKRDDGSYQLLANYAYADGVSRGRVQDRMKALLQQSRFMLCDIYDAQEAADFKAYKALRGEKLSTLNKAEFAALYPLFQDPAYEKEGDAPEGQWVVVTSDDFKIWVENMGDSMKLWVYGKLAKPSDETKAEAILEQVRAMKLFGGADAIEAGYFSDQLWAGVAYKYEGRSGKDIEKALIRFIDKDSDGFFGKVRKIYQNGL